MLYRERGDAPRDGPGDCPHLTAWRQQHDRARAWRMPIPHRQRGRRTEQVCVRPSSSHGTASQDRDERDQNDPQGSER